MMEYDDRAAPARPIGRGAACPGSAFPVAETHGIALWPENRLVMHSDGMRWSGLYASVASETPWQAALPAVGHLCLAYCLRRSARISRTMDGESMTSAVLASRLFGMIPPRVGSHWDVAGSPEILLIYVRGSLLQQVAAEVFDRAPDRIDIAPGLGFADPLLEQLVLAVLGELRAGDAHSALYVDTLAHAIAVQLLRHHDRSHKVARLPAPGLSRLGLDRVLDYIEASLDEDLRIERIARIAGLSPLSFAREFRRQIGVAPHQYVLRRRVERARTLLSDTDMPIVDIALGTGFASQSHFTSTFKRVLGVTPGEYRHPVRRMS